MRFFTSATVAALIFTCGVTFAQERVSGGSMETQMTWTGLSTLVHDARAQVDGLGGRFDALEKCSSAGKLYAPSDPDSKKGCITIEDVNNIIECGKQKLLYNGKKCIDLPKMTVSIKNYKLPVDDYCDKVWPFNSTKCTVSVNLSAIKDSAMNIGVQFDELMSGRGNKNFSSIIEGGSGKFPASFTLPNLTSNSSGTRYAAWECDGCATPGSGWVFVDYSYDASNALLKVKMSATGNWKGDEMSNVTFRLLVGNVVYSKMVASTED